jgi:hypothetical protein
MQAVTYRLNEADLTHARRYTYNNSPVVRALRLIVVIMILAGALLGGYRAIQRDWSAAASPVGWVVLGLVLIAWMLLADRLLLPHSVRKAIASNKALQSDIKLSWGEAGIEFDASHGHSRWPWLDFYKWQESAGGLLLWPGNGTFHYVPKRVLTDDQASEIRTNLASALGKPGRRRK